MNKIIYVIFFIVHLFIYYRAFHQMCIEKTKEYLEINEQNTEENLPEHTDHSEWMSTLYKLMKEEWVKDILYPISSECTGGEKKCYRSGNKDVVIPYNKLISKETQTYQDEYTNSVKDFYVEDENKNMIKLDVSILHLEKPIYINNNRYILNPFYILNCIAQWEQKFHLNELSPNCFRVPHNEVMQVHTHIIDIINDLIYPRYIYIVRQRLQERLGI